MLTKDAIDRLRRIAETYENNISNLRHKTEYDVVHNTTAYQLAETQANIDALNWAIKRLNENDYY